MYLLLSMLLAAGAPVEIPSETPCVCEVLEEATSVEDPNVLLPSEIVLSETEDDEDLEELASLEE